MEERYYDEYASIQDHHWWFAGRRRIIESVLRDQVGTDLGTVLDCGCGTGPMLETLARFGEVHGVDAERAAVGYCHRRGFADVQVVPAGAPLPFADGDFGLVTLLDVIEHVEDDRALLAEAARVLRADGTLLVTVPAYTWMWGEQDRISHHLRRYTRPRLCAALAGAGLTVRRATYFNTLLFPGAAAIRLARRVVPERDEARSDFELNKPGPLNSALARVFSSEAAILRRANLPFGVSILALATPASRRQGRAGRP